MNSKTNISFIFRLSPNEKRALELMAKRDDRNLSEMLRELIREGAKARGLEPIGLIDEKTDELH